jgi:hypothetical protein
MLDVLDNGGIDSVDRTTIYATPATYAPRRWTLSAAGPAYSNASVNCSRSIWGTWHGELPRLPRASASSCSRGTTWPQAKRPMAAGSLPGNSCAVSADTGASVPDARMSACAWAVTCMWPHHTLIAALDQVGSQ